MGFGPRASVSVLLGLLLAVFAVSLTAAAGNGPERAPPDTWPVTLFNETFPVSSLDTSLWTIDSGTPQVDALGENPPSLPYSLHFPGPAVSLSRRIDLAGYASAALILMWERGGTYPSAPLGDDLIVTAEIGTIPRALGTCCAGGVATHVYEEAIFPLPPEALRSVFSLRIRNLGPSGHWFVDDIRLVAQPIQGLEPWVLIAFAALGVALVLATAYATHERTNRVTVPESEKVTESEALKAFLQMNPEEGFDLEALNSTDTKTLGKEALRNKHLSQQVMRKVEELLPRVRAETEDPALARALLRNKTLDWYKRSPGDRTWGDKMPPRWSGIFHESRVPGARLNPKLTSRLAILHTECAKASGIVRGSLRTMVRGKGLSGGLMRLRLPLMHQVSQAYLDDLASRSRTPYRPFPLERLSELARKIGSAEMNRTLGELFPHDGGPLVVLDSRYHPDMDAVIVRSPPPKATGDSIVYDLVHTKTSISHQTSSLDIGGTEENPSSPWDRKGITKKDWAVLLGQLEKRREKLDAPPVENHRNNDAYLALRELVVADPEARKSFLAVHWRGKPSGLNLLAELLSEGSFVPDVDTDGDYLEAELGHIEKGDPEYRPKSLQWHLGHGWTAACELAQGNQRTYRADLGALA